jgi:hypothetical protein
MKLARRKFLHVGHCRPAGRFASRKSADISHPTHHHDRPNGCRNTYRYRRATHAADLVVGHVDMIDIRSGVRDAANCSFAPKEWLVADALGDPLLRLLPADVNVMLADEAAMLATVLGEDGEVLARCITLAEG